MGTGRNSSSPVVRRLPTIQSDYHLGASGGLKDYHKIQEYLRVHKFIDYQISTRLSNQVVLLTTRIFGVISTPGGRERRLEEERERGSKRVCVYVMVFGFGIVIIL